MPAFRGSDGRVIYVPEEQADRYRVGSEYQEVGNETAGAIANQIAPTHTGITGTLGAAASSALSGATLGASDFALKGLLDTNDFEQVAQDRRDNPIVSGVGQVAGAVAPMLLSGGAAAPAGALGRLAAGAAEGAGLGTRLAIAAGEGAVQNAGIYLSDVALGDRNLTAEGINGALGTGLLFGAAGIPVAHGIEAGTIAARRMFARYAEGGTEAANAATAAWTEQAQKHLEGFDQAAELAKAKLAETQTAREAANLQRLRAGSEMADARAFTPPSEFPGAPPAAAAPGVAGEAAPAAGAVAGEPPEVAMARALRDRAKDLGGQPITPGEIQPGMPGFRRNYVIPGERPPAAPNALEQLAQQPGVTTQGPATLARTRGIVGPPVTADEAELGARLGEYQAARRSFDELHAQVDPDLDAVLRGVQPGDVQRPPVPIGEFGAPGAGGFKSQEELARLASGTDAEAGAREIRDLTAGRAARSEEGTAVLAKGTQPRSLGEVAAEQAPGANAVPIEPAGNPEPGWSPPRAGGSGKPYEFASEEGFRDAQNQFRSKLTGDEIKQSLRFSREYYMDVNRALRGDLPPLDPKAAEQITPVLDRVLAKSEIDHPIVTHRAVHFDPGTPQYDLKPGDTLHDPGFGSTAWRSDNIHRFGNVHLVIESPAGTRIAPIPSSAAEGELTLARGTSMEITGREVHPDGKITLRARVVAQDGNPALSNPGARRAGHVVEEGTPAPTAASTGGPLEIRRIRQGGKVTFEAKLPDGSTRALADRGEVAALAESELPQGWHLGDRFIETHRDLAIEHGLPKDAASIRDNALYVARPSELADHGIVGGELTPERGASIAEARQKGATLDPIEIKVDAKGRYWLDDGNHRLQQAAKADSPVAIKFTPVKEFEWKGGSVDISERLRGALPGGEGAAVASAPVSATARHGRIEVHEVGRTEQMRATMPDGSTRDLGKDGARAFLKEQMPPGFYPDKIQTHQSFAVGRVVPKTAADVEENAIVVTRPSELAKRDLFGNELKEANRDKILELWKDGKEVPPIDAHVMPNGRIYVEDGNHRLQAAASDDREVAIRFKSGEQYTPQRGAREIGDRIRGELPSSAAAAGGHAATDTLTGQLRGMQSKLGAGEDLVAMGAPARDAYRAAKAERTTQAAEHFRGKALAAREARAGAVAAGETPNPFHEPTASGGGAEMDQFFRNLNTPRTRDAYVAANIGRAMREEGSHAAGLAKVEREWAERPGAVRPAEGHPFEVKRLEMAHDAALERAATATDPAERAAAAQEAQQIEKQITQVGARPGAVEDIAAIAPALTRVEKAAAALTEALGDAAPAAAREHAAAFRAAEDEASRKTTARIGQAADDAATGRAAAQNRDPLAPPARPADDPLLGPSQKQQRIAAAQKAQREAGAAYAKARVAEAEAQIGAKQTAGAAAAERAKLGPPPEASSAPSGGAGIGHRVVQGAHVVGFAADLASDVGIPGIPRPHDIPVIGPMLSAYLKYRALRAAAGRFMGRVPATAETQAAALAARTRDGIARAVDRSLGLVERNVSTVRAALTVGTLKATDALSKRLVDDGSPDAPAKASVSEQAAVRMREVAAVAANPALIHDAIRAQGRALTDPDLIDALSGHLVAMFQRLSEVAPKGPPPNPFTGKTWTPSPAEAIRFGQQVAIARDPQVAFQMLEAGTLTPTGADTLRKCYALLFRDGQARVIQRATDLKNPVDYSQLIRLGRLFDMPLHPSQDPANAAVLAGAHTPAAKPAPAAGSGGGPPTPSIAGPTTLSNLYQPSGERAQR